MRINKWQGWNIMQRLFVAYLLLIFSTTALSVETSNNDSKYIPDVLKTWTPWVLHQQSQINCPQHASDVKDYYCVWPSWLHLTLSDNGAEFKQQWQVYQPTWVALPGDKKTWPIQVSGADKVIPVVARDGKPFIWLEPGEHDIHGRFQWQHTPDRIVLPKTNALIKLYQQSSENSPAQLIPHPQIDGNGVLWVKQPEIEQTIKDALNVRVVRRLQDGIPFEVETQIELQVAGQPREIMMGKALLSDFVITHISSSLPIRVDHNGMLQAQVRAGRWQIKIQARHAADPEQLTIEPQGSPWPESEVWFFSAASNVRQLKLSGVSAIDPSQAQLPEAWRKLPAYLMTMQDSMNFAERSRGDQGNINNLLSLQRQAWLGFSGDHLTVMDNIRGKMREDWRLDMQAPYKLGQASVQGQPRLVTQNPKTQAIGVEVRERQLQLTTVSQVPRQSSLPVSGWQQTFTSVDTTLNLPPGWKVLAAFGVDATQGVWLHTWRLWDVFIVLLTAVAFFKLSGIGAGLLALVTLILSYHTPAAPKYLWLMVMISAVGAAALAKYKIGSVLLRLSQGVTLILVLVLSAFILKQMQLTMFPQLSAYYTQSSQVRSVSSMQNEIVQESVSGSTLDDLAPLQRQREYKTKAQQNNWSSLSQKQKLDIDGAIQTGPGVPQWRGVHAKLHWDGPVADDQHVQLVLLSPWMTALWRLAQMVLVLSLFVVVVLKVREAMQALSSVVKSTKENHALPTNKPASGGSSSLLIGGLSLLLSLMAVPETSWSNDFPDSDLLQELKQRLTKQPECTPQCASFNQGHLHLKGDDILLRLEVHAGAHVSVPLPADRRYWIPELVLVNGEPAKALRQNEKGQLFVALTEGVHQIHLKGQLQGKAELQLPFSASVYNMSYDLQAWEPVGVLPESTISGRLELIRQQAVNSENRQQMTRLQPDVIKPFVRVERVLSFDVEWYVETHVVRVAPNQGVISLWIPLLNNESVLTQGLKVRDNKAHVYFGENVQKIVWQSRLNKTLSETPSTYPIELQAPEQVSWVERWKVLPSHRWQVATAGLNAITAQATQVLSPEWYPWPGESLRLSLLKPQAVEGSTLTIDKALLQQRPGRHLSNYELTLSVRSSRGDKLPVLLSHQAEQIVLNIDGRRQSPSRQSQDGKTLVSIDIKPGEQQVKLRWQQTEGLGTVLREPEVEVGQTLHNLNIEMAMPQGRWLVWTSGPQLGPVLMFWPWLLLATLLIIPLKRYTRCPLKWYEWLLLALGLNSVGLWVLLPVIVWFLALEWRGRMDRERIQNLGASLFNLIQVAAVIATVAVLVMLVVLVPQGLLGRPDMQVMGNASSYFNLRWFLDVQPTGLPKLMVISFPIWVYQTAMLLWSLWLAFALLRWGSWGWKQLSSQELWLEVKSKAKSNASASYGQKVTQQDSGNGVTKKTDESTPQYKDKGVWRSDDDEK